MKLSKRLGYMAAVWLMASGQLLASTAVTATVTDADGTAWANAAYTISFYATTQCQGISGQSIFGGVLDGSGELSETLPSACAAGGSWQVTLCPTASVPCVSTVVSISGASQDISTALSAAAIAPRFTAGPGAYGYADVEATALVTGQTYYNVVSGALKVWTGSAWSSVNFTCNSGNNCAALDAANTFTDLQTLSAGASIPQGVGITMGKFTMMNPTSDPNHVQLTRSGASGNIALDVGNISLNNGPSIGSIKIGVSGFEITQNGKPGTTYIQGGKLTTEQIGSSAAANNDLRGHLTLSSGTATYTFIATYTTAPTCVATDTTAANAVQVSTTTTTLTLTGTGTDVLNYICAD